MKKRFTPETMKQITYVTWPVISKDGSRIAYVSYTAKEEDGSFPSRIHCITGKDGGKLCLTVADGNSAKQPQLIADEVQEVWLSGADGSSAKQPQFLPDGVQLACLSDQTGENQVFIKNLETGEMRQVTTLRHGIERYSLTEDGTRLVFEAVLWPEEIEGGCAFEEMDAGEKARWKEELDYRPYYITDLVYKMDEWHGMRKGEFSHIGIVNLDGSGQRLIDTGGMEAVYPAWSQDGELLAFYGYPYGGAKGRDAELFMCRADGSEVRQITRDAGLSADHCPVFMADGRSVLGMAYPDFGDGSCMLLPYLAHLDEPERSGLLFEQWEENVCHGVYPLAAGRLEYGEKTPYFSLSPDGNYLYFISGFHGRTGLYRVRLPQEFAEGSRQECKAEGESRKRTDGAESMEAGTSSMPEIELVCQGATDLQEYALDSQGHLVTVMSSWTEPAELYLDGKKLTDSNPWLKEYELAPVEEHWIRSRDGKVELQYFLVRPVAGNAEGNPVTGADGHNDGAQVETDSHSDGMHAETGDLSGNRYPAVLDVKGGPQTMYGLAFWHEFQALAGAGLGVIYGNPRGSVGFGREFCAGGVCWKQEVLDDLLAMVDDAVSQGWIDSKRIGVTGGSYGGYMTNKLIGRTDYFAAAVTQRCLANTATSYGTGDMGFVSAGEIPKDFRMLDYLVDRARGNIISFIDHFKVPLLILHAYEDYRCSFEQAEQVFVAMKERNPEVPVRLVMFPEENHAMTRTGKLHHQIRHLQEMADWFTKYLKVEEDGEQDTAQTEPACTSQNSAEAEWISDERGSDLLHMDHSESKKMDKDGEKHE